MIPQRIPLLAQYHALKKLEIKETNPFPKLPNVKEEETGRTNTGTTSR